MHHYMTANPVAEAPPWSSRVAAMPTAVLPAKPAQLMCPPQGRREEGRGRPAEAASAGLPACAGCTGAVERAGYLRPGHFGARLDPASRRITSFRCSACGPPACQRANGTGTPACVSVDASAWAWCRHTLGVLTAVLMGVACQRNPESGCVAVSCLHSLLKDTGLYSHGKTPCPEGGKTAGARWLLGCLLNASVIVLNI